MNHWQGQGQEDENQGQQEQEPEQGQGVGQQEPEQGLGHHLDLQSTSSEEWVEELVQHWLWGRCRGQGQEVP